MVIDLNVLPDGNGGRGDAESEHCSRKEGRCGNGLEKIYPTTAVRYGHMNYVGEFTHPPEMKFGCGGKVVIRTNRGIEVGEQVSLTCSGCDNSVTREQIQRYIKNSGPEYYQPDSGRILRGATADDLREEARMRADCPAKLEFCQAAAARFRLPLKVIECEHLFGGERIVFYFLAERRVDFRALVKEMASEYQTRIEMRQVGVRDEARLLADYETCGRECCCKTFLKTLRPVSMKMAKMQKATLDPSKVSGRCGRLKCCLRYEHVGYEELEGKLPRIGSRISTAHGDGVVVNRQILTQLVQIQVDGGALMTVAIEDVLAPGDAGAGGTGAERPAAAPRAERSRRPERPTAGPADMTSAASDPPDARSANAKPGPEQRSRRRRRRRRRGGSGQSNDSRGNGASPAAP